MEALKVLLAEDDLFVSMSLRLRLEQLGFIVVGEAANGLEAVIAADQHKPDIILMDIRMPQMDGLEAAQAILEKHSIPIIFLTAYDEIELIEKAGLIGASGYLVKPISDKNLSSNLLMASYRKNNDRKNRSSGAANSNGTGGDEGLYIKTFGGFDIYFNGVLLQHNIFGNSKSGARKTKAILAYLIFKNNVNKDDLLELFWPLSDWDAATKSLNRTIHSLKRVLQPGLDKGKPSTYLLQEDGRCKLNMEQIKVDANIFETKLKTGCELLKKNDFAGAEREIAQAAHIYTGEWMKGVKDAEDWCIAERERLKNCYIEAKLKLAGLAEQRGRADEAILHYQDILSQDPYVEQANAVLVKLFIKLGRHDLAKKQNEIYAYKLKSLDSQNY